ncbi:MAG: heparinase II/III family protein, partial [Planctomycetota bacterium]
MNPLSKIYWIGKGVGWDNVPRRVYQAFASKSGMLQKWTRAEDYRANEPIAAASDEALVRSWQEKRQRFLPLAKQQQLRELVPETVWEASVGQTCRDALAGQYPFFSRWQGELGWPPNFNLDPVHHLTWRVGEHCTNTTRSGPPRDDIKLVWEASRFTLAYHLTRHYVYTGDERWAERFWTMFEAWREQNPVNLTVAWGCGQEVAFRLMAILFGTMVTLPSPHCTASRLRDVSLFAWQAGKRIAANIKYALSPDTTHALREAEGLWTVGVLFPELKEAEKWRNQGRRVLEHEVRRQIYEDGS